MERGDGLRGANLLNDTTKIGPLREAVTAGTQALPDLRMISGEILGSPKSF